MSWERLRRGGGILLAGTGLIGLISFPADLRLWSSLLAPVWQFAIWGALTLLGLFLLAGPGLEKRLRGPGLTHTTIVGTRARSVLEPFAVGTDVARGSGRAPDPFGKAEIELQWKVSEELATIVDEGMALNREAFRPPSFGQYVLWRDKTKAFLETVFGVVERQRFTEPLDPTPAAPGYNIEDHLTRLRDLRDRPASWQLEVNAEGLRKASADRGKRSEAERILESPADPSQHEEVDKTAREQMPTSEVERAAAGSRRLRQRLLGLLEQGTGLQAQFQAAPVALAGGALAQEAEFWIAKVGNVLERSERADLADEFLRRTVGEIVLPALLNTSGQASSVMRRLDSKVGALRRIIRTLDAPAPSPAEGGA